MIQKFLIVQNEKIAVCYNCTFDTVIVQAHYNGNNKIFSGFDGLKESFETFQDCIAEETTFNDAVDFFTPRIQQVWIGGAFKK